MAGLMILAMTTMVAIQGEVAALSGKVLLVSMDGFRADYISTVQGLGNFSRLANMGCRVTNLINAFATITFPSHYTIVTGLYEESHGIVSNSMYDPLHNATFTKASQETFWWDGGEPIWITAEKKKRNSSAVYFWVGSEAEVQGLRPSIYKQYSDNVPFVERVETVAGWLKDLDKDFVALYFHEPDSTGHKFGPMSVEVADKLREMDGILGLILDSLDRNGLGDKVNLILTSDHGMAEVNYTTRLIDLYQYVNASMVDRVPNYGVVTHILPKPGLEAEVLTQAKRLPGNCTVYRKEEIPEGFHYKHHRRIMPIVVLCDEGWTLTANKNKTLSQPNLGDHGYSSELASMRPILYVAGPDFRQGLVHEQPLHSVDIYPLLCHLLGLTPAPHNGSLQRALPLLRDTGDSTIRPALTTTFGGTSSRCALVQIQFAGHRTMFAALMFCFMSAVFGLL